MEWIAMAQQSVFFDEHTPSKRVQVLKVFDVSYARSCFEEMDERALAFLSRSLDLEGQFQDGGTYVAREDIEEQAREDGNLLRSLS